MVMLDVVIVVRVPCVAHQRVDDVGEESIDDSEARRLGEDAPHVNVLVHHKAVGAHIIELHSEVENSMNIGEVVEEKASTRHQGSEVENQMCQHYHISLVAHDILCPDKVMTKHPVVQESRQAGRHVSGINSGKDGRLEPLVRGVIESFENGYVMSISLGCTAP